MFIEFLQVFLPLVIYVLLIIFLKKHHNQKEDKHKEIKLKTNDHHQKLDKK